MAADVVLEPNQSNPCCAKLMKKYLKVKNDKQFVVQGAKSLGEMGEKLSKENAQLRKALEEQQLYGKQEREEREKESYTRQNLEKEINNLKAEISSYQNAKSLKSANEDEIQLRGAQIRKQQEELGKLKDLLQKEKQRSDFEMKKAEMEKKKATEALELVKTEKSKAEQERKLAGIERKKVEEYRISMEKVKSEATKLRAKLNIENSKAEDARKDFEAEKNKASTERKRADLEVAKVQELKRLIETEQKKAIDEKVRADQLSLMLEEEKKRRKELQERIDENVSYLKGMSNSCLKDKRGGDVDITGSVNMKLLSEQLRLKKKEVKLAKRMSKLEKEEKGFVMRELHLLKHSFMQILYRFDMLDNHLSHSIEGTDAVAKIGKYSELHGIKLHDNLPGSKRGNYNLGVDCGPTETCWRGALNTTESTRECNHFPLARESCLRPSTCIITEMESPTGGSIGHKSQSSATCLDTSFTDKRSVGSQGKDTVVLTASSKLKHSTQRSTVHELPSENDKIRVTKDNLKKRQRELDNASACIHDALEGGHTHSLKRRKIHGTTEPGLRMLTEDNHLHFNTMEKSSVYKDAVEGGISATNHLLGCGIYNSLESGIRCLCEEPSEIPGNYCKPSSDKMSNKQQISTLAHADISNQCHKFSSQIRINERLSTEISHQVRGNASVEQEHSALINEQADLLCFENMIRGNYLKMLDLDNDADEERYRMAIEMPLSPTLPDIEFSCRRSCGEVDSQSVMDRGIPEPLRSFDVMDLEVRASDSAWNLHTHEGRTFHYTMKEHEDNCTIRSQNDASEPYRLDNAKHIVFPHVDESLAAVQSRSAGSSVDKMIGEAIMGGVHQQTKAPVNFTDASAFPHSKVNKDIVPAAIERPLLLNKIVGSHILTEDQCLQNSNISTSVVNRQNITQKLGELANSGLLENLSEDEGSASEVGNVSSSKIKLPRPESEEPSKCNKNIFCAELVEGISVHPQLEASKQASLFPDNNNEDSSGDNADVGNSITPVYSFAYSFSKDKASISRMLSVWRRLAPHKFLICQIDNMIVQVHDALAKDTVLLPEEKAGALFSLLLCNISNRMSVKTQCTISGDHLAHTASFVAEIRKVLSNGETISLLEEICQLDILATLIEDFLIERQLLFIFTDRLHGCMDTLSYLFQLDGTNMHVFCGAAAVEYFGAGCILLASIFAEAGRIGYLLDTSYKILRLSTSSTSSSLVALHIFALVCGEDYFKLQEHSFLIITLRSVVLYLEKGHQIVSPAAPFLRMVYDRDPSFPPCKACSFATGAICMDKLINLLLDVLECYSTSGVRDPNTNYSVTSPLYPSPACTEIGGESSNHKSKLDGKSDSSDSSCCLFKFKKHLAGLPDCFPESTICYFADIVSLVELVGRYMSWELTCHKVIPRLSKMLEFCKCEEFSAALFVLMGHLGRFGIDLAGHSQKGIAELTCSLSVLIESAVAKKKSLPTQIAAVNSLLKLLPITFRDAIDENWKRTLDTSHSDHAQLIKKWFSQLNSKQQSLSLMFFEA